MSTSLKSRVIKSMHCIINKHYILNLRSIRHNQQYPHDQYSYDNDIPDIIEEDYYKQSFRYQHLNGDRYTNTNQMKLTKLDQLDITQTIYVRKNKEQYNKHKEQYNKIKNVWKEYPILSDIFEHRQYYESKSTYLKEIMDFIGAQIQNNGDDYLSQIESYLTQIESEMKLEKEMLRHDISLKLNKIHSILDEEYSAIKHSVCKDGESKEQFAKAIIDPDGNYHKELAIQITNDWRSKVI